MPIDRRRFIVATGLSVAGGALARAQAAPKAVASAAGRDWAWVREQFPARRDLAHFSMFYIASHPRCVTDAIEKLRREIDEDPFGVVEHGLFTRPGQVRAAAAEYLGGHADEVALTRCTTEGIAHVYAGVRLRPGQEVLTTTHDHYVHQEAVRLATSKAGAGMRRLALYDDPAKADADEIIARLRQGLRPETRVVGLTWVHSSTGVKLPIRRLAGVVREANAARGADDRMLLLVDGVHGFGSEDETVAEMGCDFFAAGTHKWIFGPRGTGILWGRREAWAQLQPTVPAFELPPFEAWMRGQDPGATQAVSMSPGGFHAYEHMWALPAAFQFHKELGRARVAARIHELNGRIKDGLLGLRRVKLHTPRADSLSAGLVCFEVDGLTADEVVRQLLAKRVVASASPYYPSYARLAGSLLNSPEEVDAAVRAVGGLS